MRRIALGFGLALGLAMALSGCSALTGASSFGSNKLDVADVSNIGDYTSERALSEARAHFRNADYGYSAALYKRYVELTPKSAEGYVGLGASYDRLGRFDLSDRVYASLYELQGPSAQYYNNLGYSMMLRGRLKDALGYFRKARALAPDSVVIQNNIALLTKVSRA